MSQTFTREQLEYAIWEFSPVSWDDNDCGILADCYDDLPNDCDADALAHALWTMGGADPEHEGKPDCSVGNEGQYENQCDHCEKWLTDLAAMILADLRPKPSLFEADKGDER